MLLRSGDARMAEQVCQDALKRYPEDANILCLSARSLICLKQYDDARKRLDTAIALFPDFPRPHVILGELYLAQNQYAQAPDAFKRAIHLNPDDADTYEKLRTALLLLGRSDEAEEALQESRRRNPTAVAITEAIKYERAGDLDQAEQIYRRALMQDTENFEVFRRIGAVAMAKRQFIDAEIFLQRAVDLAPDYLVARADLVIAQMELEKYGDAVKNAERLVHLDHAGPMSHLMLGNACAMSGQHENAVAEYRQVLSMQPGHLGALSGMAHMLKTMGRPEESIATYKECIHRSPHHTEAWWGLANMKTYHFDDGEIQEMLRSLSESRQKPEPASRWLTSTPEVNLCNALGVAFEGKGDYDRAFEYFMRGNRMRRLDEPYDPVHTEQLCDRIINTFDSDFLKEKSGHGCSDKDAIFIVGLPRTGSTLIEQILASHSEVDGTHELPELSRICHSLPITSFDRSQYPENVTALKTDALAATGNDYMERTRKYRTGKLRFTDKNLGNFMHIGLLHLILPNAKIIHAVRHPLDTCLGCYKQLFARGQSFSYDLVELGEYYVQYQRLMDHWDKVLPGKVLHVNYEQLVGDLEPQVRQMLKHCGLPWEAACLRFFETKRDVRTASSEQVRQPIYNSSVNLWRRYESHLHDLIAVLEPALLKLPLEDQPDTPSNSNQPGI